MAVATDSSHTALIWQLVIGGFVIVAFLAAVILWVSSALRRARHAPSFTLPKKRTAIGDWCRLAVWEKTRTDRNLRSPAKPFGFLGQIECEAMAGRDGATGYVGCG